MHKERAMSTTNETHETGATTLRPYSPTPDGRSDLPVTLPDFPPPTSGDSGDSGSTPTK